MQRLNSIFRTLVAFWMLQGWAAENKPLAEPLFDETRLAMPANPPASWLSYHLAHPGETAPDDPNGAFYWKGRYHLHYIYENKAGVSWAHVSSTDMLHWQWHPTTLTPLTMGHSMFSGTGFFTKSNCSAPES